MPSVLLLGQGNLINRMVSSNVIKNRFLGNSSFRPCRLADVLQWQLLTCFSNVFDFLSEKEWKKPQTEKGCSIRFLSGVKREHQACSLPAKAKAGLTAWSLTADFLSPRAGTVLPVNLNLLWPSLQMLTQPSGIRLPQKTPTRTCPFTHPCAEAKPQHHNKASTALFRL